MKTKDNSSNQQNANKGTSGTNKQYDHAQGNRGAQLNPNNDSAGNNSNSGNGGSTKGGKSR